MAMLAYGWTFQVGLFNYYIAIGLSFLALSILSVTRGWKRLYAIAAPVVSVEAPAPTARTTRVRRRKRSRGTMVVESLLAVEQAGRG